MEDEDRYAQNINEDELFEQMFGLIAKATGEINTNQEEDLIDTETRIADIIRRNAHIVNSWTSDHIYHCNHTDCDITEITVIRYPGSLHLCVELNGEKICDAPEDATEHAGNKNIDPDYFLCRTTGMVRTDAILFSLFTRYICADRFVERSNSSLLRQTSMYVRYRCEYWVFPCEENGGPN